jgi:hypothetical protein
MPKARRFLTCNRRQTTLQSYFQPMPTSRRVQASIKRSENTKQQRQTSIPDFFKPSKNQPKRNIQQKVEKHSSNVQTKLTEYFSAIKINGSTACKGSNKRESLHSKSNKK